MGELFGMSKVAASPVTIRNWCLKYGLYALTQSVPKGKYVLICDESIEIGRERLLAILAVPIELYCPVAPLRLTDVVVLDLKVCVSWTSQQLAEMIQAKKKAYGIEFVYSLSDKCSRLRKAFAICGLPWIGDCTHQMANTTKALLGGNKEYNAFIKRLNALRAKWILSKHNFYIPPALRSKSRFHQVFIVHKWAQTILQQWDSIPCDTRTELDFVKQNESLVLIMKHLHDLTSAFATIFKSRGIQPRSLAQWEALVAQYKAENQLGPKANEFIVQMGWYLEHQQAKLGLQTQILCCSDVIESMFGKYKNKGKVKMITDDVLEIAAYPKAMSQQDIQMAMQKVKLRDIAKWKKENTTVSKLALIKKARQKSAA